MAFQCRIVHAIAGRTRLRVPALSRHTSLAAQMSSYLRHQPGVVAVSITLACDSIVVRTEPARWTADALCQLITALSPAMLQTYAAPRPLSLQPLPAPEPPWLALSVSSLAVVASVVAEPVAPLLVPLLLSSAWPILARALAAMRQRQLCTTDVADATATTLLAVQGQWLAAAALVWLVHLTDALRATAHTRASQALADAVTAAPQRTWLRQHHDAALAETQLQPTAEQWAATLLPGRAVMAGVVSLVTGDAAQAAAVLIVGHQAGMQGAAPATVLAALTQAARHGILITGGRHLEALAQVDALVFETAAPLTQGTPEVVRIMSYRHPFPSDRLLALAAALEQHVPHPVAQAIVWEAQARALDLPEPLAVVYTRGLGVEAVIEDTTVCVGNERFMADKAIPLTQRAERDVQRLAQRAANVLFVAVDGRLCGLVAYTDPVRPDASDAIHALQAHGIKALVMLAQDHSQVTQQDINALGLSRDDTALLPEEHAAVVRHLHTAGYTVAVVGDGRDDSLVWSEADVRIALQDSLTRAPVPHVILSEATLRPLPLAIRVARDSRRQVQQHWHVITVANMLAFGLASLGGIGPLGALGLSKGSALAVLGRALFLSPFPSGRGR